MPEKQGSGLRERFILGLTLVRYKGMTTWATFTHPGKLARMRLSRHAHQLPTLPHALHQVLPRDSQPHLTGRQGNQT